MNNLYQKSFSCVVNLFIYKLCIRVILLVRVVTEYNNQSFRVVSYVSITVLDHPSKQPRWYLISINGVMKHVLFV